MEEILYTVGPEETGSSKTFQVVKSINEYEIAIIINNISAGCEFTRITYKNINDEFTHPFLSWYNLIFCSDCFWSIPGPNGVTYGPSSDRRYLNRAVQQGTKTAATVYLKPTSKEGKMLIKELPIDCAAMPYGDSMIYVYHKGSLSSFFDFERIKLIYERHGVRGIDWKVVEDYFNKELAYFGNEEICGFSLQSGGYREQIIITGLILGYPIESTIAILRQ